MGYTASGVATARDAREEARRAPPNVFLVDVRLGRESGLDLVHELRQGAPDSLFVVMTAYAGPEAAVGAIKAGAYDYITKPFEMSDLFATLDRCFDWVRLQEEKNAARAALRESEALYREVFEKTSDGLFVLEVTPDRRYRLVSYNPAQEVMLGISSADVLGKYAEEYLPDSVLEIVLEQNRQVVESGRTMTFPSALDLPGGRRFFSTTLVPVKNAEGRVHRIIGLARDMTENRRMLEALRQSEEKFSKAFHGSPDSITISTIDDGIILDANRGFFNVYGYEPEEVIGRSSLPGDLGVWVNPEDRERMVAMVRERGEAVGEWLPFRRKNGTIRYGLTSWRVIELDGKRLVLSMTRDMTERKAMEEALRDSEARFRLLAENSTDLISRIGPDGTHLYVSPACTALLGWSPEELAGTSPCEHVHPEDAGAVRASLETVRAKQAPDTVTYRIRRRDGTYTWFETVSRAIRDPVTGGVAEVQCSSRDISERVRAQEKEKTQELQLFQAAKLASLGTLVSGIAHEINNPNNFIRLNSQNLKEFWGDMRTILDAAAGADGPLSLHGIPWETARGMVDDLLQGIGEGSKRIEKLLLNLRDFARGDEGSLDEDVDLGAVVRSAVMIVQNLIQKSTARFSVAEHSPLPPVRGNYHQLEQVVINLVTNACQALPSRDRRVTVDTRSEDGGASVTLVVADEGVGIPAANIPRVVDPFFTTKRQAGGSGLGLAVSSRIVQNHGGTMSFTSQVGRGTNATVRLPAAGRTA
jgi:hypothetical protein